MAWPFGILGSPCFSPSGTWPYKEKGLKFVKSKTGGVLDQFHTHKSYDFLFALSLSTFHLEFTVVENHLVCLIIMKTFRFILNFFKDVSDETFFFTCFVQITNTKCCTVELAEFFSFFNLYKTCKSSKNHNKILA